MIYKFFDKNWAAHLVEVGSLFFKNQGVKYLSCVIVIFTKYAWVKSLKDTRAKTGLINNENFTLVLCKNS